MLRKSSMQAGCESNAGCAHSGVGYCPRWGTWPVTISSRITPKLHMSAQIINS